MPHNTHMQASSSTRATPPSHPPQSTTHDAFAPPPTDGAQPAPSTLPPILQRHARQPTQGPVSPANGAPFRRRRTDQSGSGQPRGFTLIEILFTVAIVATLCAISLPSFSAVIASSHARAANNTLITALNFARNSAVNHQSDIVICPSRDNLTCDTSIWWQHGWIVFQDTNRNGSREAGERIFTIAQAQSAIAIATTAGREHVTYRPDGSATGTNLTFTLCDRRGAKYASTVIISNTGRARHAPATPAEAAAACAGLQ